MLKALLPLVLLSLVSIGASAQDWREKLSAELVTIEAGKMVFEEYGLVKLQFPGYEESRFQIKLHSEVPQGGAVSRDNFVALTSSYFTIIMMESLAQAYQVTAAEFLEAFDYTELESLIGTADLEMNLFMTNEGLQIEIVNTSTGEQMRHTMTWAEVYEG